eukprot:GHVS01088395.1.p1 GENE.GHVS01088395.1~~GHVS01088395.1.p1  ORF type:complete len:1004 (+),score=178.91 GHVS01088395.1:167-3178(+)
MECQQQQHSPATSRGGGARISQAPTTTTGCAVTVIHEGWLSKYTNIMSSWRPRYFKLQPGLLCYSLEKNASTKEVIKLAKCQVRVCPGDLVRLEVDTPDQGTLWLRADTPEEKNVWYAAIKQAQLIRVNSTAFGHNSQLRQSRALQQDSARTASATGGGSRSPVVPSEKQTGGRRGYNTSSLLGGGGVAMFAQAEEVQDSMGDMSPLVCLVENCMACRQHVQYAYGEIRALQANLIARVGSLHTQMDNRSHIPEALKADSLRLIERVDFLEKILDRHLAQVEALVSEETLQRRQLEKSLKWLAKQNYRMEKAQQRSIAAGTPIQPPALSLPSPGTPGKRRASNAGGMLVSAGGVSGDSKRGGVVVGGGGKSDERMADVGNERRDEVYGGEEEEEESESEVEAEIEAAEFYECEEDDEKSMSMTTREGVSRQKQKQDVEYRTVLPKPRTDFKVSLWSILKDCLGKDLSKISMPVYFNEPTSFLQRLAEDLQYADLVKQAAVLPDSCHRLAMVSVFSASPYASAIGRTYKPFNPLLGETYELSHRGFKFLAEQVGHHPPVTAYHVECDEFISWGHLAVKTKLSGKSLEVTMPGPIHMIIPSSVHGDHYTFVRAKMLVHNVIFGKLWIELDGAVVVHNHSTGDYAVCQFLKKGWFDRTVHQFRGLVFDSSGQARYRMGGVWSHEMWIEQLQTDNRTTTTANTGSGSNISSSGTGNYAGSSSTGSSSSSSNVVTTTTGSSSSSSSSTSCSIDRIDNIATICTDDHISPLPPPDSSSCRQSNNDVLSRSRTEVVGRRRGEKEEVNRRSSDTAAVAAVVGVEEHSRSFGVFELDEEEGMRRTEESNVPANRRRCVIGFADHDTVQLLEEWERYMAVPGTRHVVWRPDPRPHYAEQYYGFGYMTMQLNHMSAHYCPSRGAVMPHTDSRFRPDQRGYEEGYTDIAIAEKHRLEEKQRGAARARAKGEDDYTPRWFEKGNDRITGESAWLYKGDYWESKEKGIFKDCPDIYS